MSLINDFLKNLNVEYFFGCKILYEEVIGESKDKRLESAVYSKFFYIVDGVCRFVIDKKEYIVSKGDLILLPANIPHFWSFLPSTSDNPQKVTLAGFHFNVHTGNSCIFNMLHTAYVCKVKDEKYIMNLFSDLFKAGETNTLSARMKTTSNILALLSYFLDNTQDSNTNISTPIVYKVMSHIKNNLNDSININELSKLAGYSPTHLIRIFKEQTGYTPLQFSLWNKMNLAVGLLENTTTPIGEIIEKIGFFDASHFSRTFKRFHGCSPSEYRKKYFSKTHKSVGILLDDN